MKVGDRVYCIKDIEFVSKYITTKVFVSGNVYSIYEIGVLGIGLLRGF